MFTATDTDVQNIANTHGVSAETAASIIADLEARRTEHANMTEPTFNWQTSSEGDFVKWLVPEILGDMSPAKFDEAAEATNNFESVNMRVTIGGVEVNALSFFKTLEKSLDNLIDRETSKKIATIEPLKEIEEMIEHFSQDVKHRIFQAADAAGINPWDVPE